MRPERFFATILLAGLALWPATPARAASSWDGTASVDVQVQTFPLLGTELVSVDLTISPPLDGGEAAYIVDRTDGLTLMDCQFGASCSAFEFIQISDTRTFIGEIEVPAGGPVVEASSGITVSNGHLSRQPPATPHPSAAPSSAAPPSAAPESPAPPQTPAAHPGVALQPGTSSAPPAPTGAWSVPFTDTNNQLMVACSIEGQPFSRCILDTGNQFSAVVPASIWDGLGIAPTQRFVAEGLTGSSPAYAGTGSVAIGGHSVETLVTEDPSDNFDYPNIGLSTLQALCFGGNGAVAFDWRKHAFACVPG